MAWLTKRKTTRNPKRAYLPPISEPALVPAIADVENNNNPTARASLITRYSSGSVVNNSG